MVNVTLLFNLLGLLQCSVPLFTLIVAEIPNTVPLWWTMARFF